MYELKDSGTVKIESEGKGFQLGAKLFKEINDRLANIDKEDLVKRMGYHRIDVGKKSLRILLERGNLYLWLKLGHFDFVYDSESFLLKLTEELEISKDHVEAFVSWAKGRLRNISRMKGGYVFVNTKDRPRGMPAYARVFCEGYRRIALNREIIVNQDKDWVLSYVSFVVRNHCIRNYGKLPVWGTIVGYVYEHTDGSRYAFDINGNIVKDVEIKEEYGALLLVGNKSITFELPEISC